jgi:DNA-directed RNA polymerase specialized sigma24 family protein
MTPDADVTGWLNALKEGTVEALQPLWNVYYRRLVELAGRKLPAGVGVSDSEVASSAFHSFYRGLAAGRFPNLNDRFDFWHLLVFITGQKIADHLEHRNAIKRGRGFMRVNVRELQDLLSRDPTPEFAAAAAEQCQKWIARLDADGLGQIAVWKMEGHTHQEIASLSDCSLRTLTNKLELIRQILITEIGT